MASSQVSVLECCWYGTDWASCLEVMIVIEIDGTSAQHEMEVGTRRTGLGDKEVRGGSSRRDTIYRIIWKSCGGIHGGGTEASRTATSAFILSTRWMRVFVHVVCTLHPQIWSLCIEAGRSRSEEAAPHCYDERAGPNLAFRFSTQVNVGASGDFEGTDVSIDLAQGHIVIRARIEMSQAEHRSLHR